MSALRKRIASFTEEKPHSLAASARTDRGVSALKNFATFYLKDLRRDELLDFINSVEKYRDDGLYQVELFWADPHVHARSCSNGKKYRYTIVDNNGSFNPYSWGIYPKLDINAMKEASLLLLGEHDFSSLRGGGCEAGTTIKEIFSIEIERCFQSVIIDIEGNAFLRKMIRNMVGLLAEVGAGLRKPCDVSSILLQKDRQAAGIMAPAQGLCLMKVQLHLEKNSLIEVSMK